MKTKTFAQWVPNFNRDHSFMRSRVLCFLLAVSFSWGIIAEERGKKVNTSLISYCLTNGSQATVSLELEFGKQQRRGSNEISLETRRLATAAPKKSNTGSTALTFSEVQGPDGYHVRLRVFDSRHNLLGSKGFFVHPNSPTHGTASEIVDPKDETITVGVSPSNQVFFSIVPRFK